MIATKIKQTTRAQESTNAIERLYITMRHLLNRGFYKPSGVSGNALKSALLLLRPEIYGSIAENKTELNGLIYVLERLPEGIEECRYINMTSDEGFSKSHLKPIIPPKRRRNCYRIDAEQMNIEITRGRSDIYDILTHLTFLFIESQKICERVLIEETQTTIRDWEKLEEFIQQKEEKNEAEREVALIHTANILGRSFDEITEIHQKLASGKSQDRFLHIIFWLGKLAIEEHTTGNKRTITFSPLLRERLGHHIHGERWAENIKKILKKYALLKRPIHIISANMHSVMNSLFAKKILGKEFPNSKPLEIYEALSSNENENLREKVLKTAQENGMTFIHDASGANIDVQIFDTATFGKEACCYEFALEQREDGKPVILVMDYAFGEQAYETIDELLKPYLLKEEKHFLNVKSISIMGKAGILEGGKGDLMIPSAHIFEGTADNYPFENEFCADDFKGHGLSIQEGTMVTVLGTSLQNKDILKFFHQSTWKVIGLEMEGVHYQKAIQSASKIRKSIDREVKVRYAYYASDNPLESGSTLASGGLGTTGVKPTYLITDKILKQIFNS
ncbi:MAG: hypothetical protein AAGB24_13405 [Bacteroidota bacterium]